MKLTDNRPTEPGWYWFKEFSDSVEGIVEVTDRETGDRLYIVDYGDELPNDALWSEKLEEPDERIKALERVKLDQLVSCLTDDERMELFSKYCDHCGCDSPNCQCWNDE